jgi:MFS superfamily sulfate permease-like transporter
MDHADAARRSTNATETPRGNLQGFTRYLKFDLISGLLVFLIALPLCLSIALAYGYPAIAGVFTAIIGGILTVFISDSELTIKGPAAGLIVIAVGCVMDFGGSGVPGDINPDAYRAALAVGVAAGVIQILFGIFRVGILGEFFPSAAVHGMLAAIGVIIIIKQIPPTFGASAKGEPFPLLLGIPEIAAHLNPPIAIVGGVSLAIMFLWPVLAKRVTVLKSIPAALAVLAISTPLAAALHLADTHTNRVELEESGEIARLGPHHSETAAKKAAGETPAEPVENDTLVHVPPFGETFSALTLPDFTALQEPKAWKWVVMFSLIGTLESMLTAKAMDLIDPWERKTNLNRDNLAVGIANTCCAMVGAAPMISEIVRSKANLDNGARTRFANLWHGVFLLSFVALLPAVISMIPIAGLTAMLIYTGYRLAHPNEFKHMLDIGIGQLVVYVTTIVAVLATDLLVGIGIGIALELLIHVANGVPVRSLFKPKLEVQQLEDDQWQISAQQSAIFSNWIPLRRQIDKVRRNKNNLVLDLSETRLVDHTVMCKLSEVEREFERDNLILSITGLESHKPLSKHRFAARRNVAVAEV